MQLKLSSEEDQAYITEIQRIWCLLLDKIERMIKIKIKSNFYLSCLF
jgi:hypothetical protein